MLILVGSKNSAVIRNRNTVNSVQYSMWDYLCVTVFWAINLIIRNDILWILHHILLEYSHKSLYQGWE